MYIGSLLAETAPVDCSCSYFRRNTNTALPSEVHSEGGAERKGQTACAVPLGWKWDTLLDEGADMLFTFTKDCFVDHITLKQSEDSSVSSLEAFTYREDGSLQKIGELRDDTKGFLCESALSLSVNYSCRKLLLRLNAACADIVIEEIDVVGSYDDGVMLYPQPSSYRRLSERTVRMSELTFIRADMSEKDVCAAASRLQKRISEMTGRELPILPESADGVGAIRIKKAEYCEEEEGGRKKIPKEGFALAVRDKQCVLTAGDRLGLHYAASALIMLAYGGEIPEIFVFDEPYMQFRGFHMGLPSKENFQFYKRFIQYCLIPMRYNTLFIQVSGALQYDRHPEICLEWHRICDLYKQGKLPEPPHVDMLCDGSYLSKQELAELTEYAKSFGLEVIPEIQSLSHVQYMTISHPEIAEKPADKELCSLYDIPPGELVPDDFYAHSFCPSNEESYRLLFDIMDEIIEVMKPERFVHMGHDEVYQIGLCEKCRNSSPAELFAKDVNRIYQYLKEKNLRMMIWGDMLQDGTEYETAQAIDLIPKDIILLDFIWYFHPQRDIEDRLIRHGFDVIMGNMYSSHYPRFKERAAKKGVIGAQMSTWTEVSEYRYASTGKIYDTVFSANMMWSRAYRQDARAAYSRRIGMDILPRLRKELRGQQGQIVQPMRYFPCVWQIDMPNSLESITAGDIQPRSDIPFVINQPILLSGSCAADRFPERAAVNLNRACGSLAFLHATVHSIKRVPRVLFETIGKYVIYYEDGSAVEIPLEYGGNIFTMDQPYATPFRHFYYRHEGYIGTYFADPVVQEKTRCGSDMTLYQFVWENPFREKAIGKVELCAEGSSGAVIAVFAVTAVV